MLAFPRGKIPAKIPKEGTPSILVLGLDSISRVNFIRTMKHSYGFLKDHLDAISLLAYNKVGGKLQPINRANYTVLFVIMCGI